MGEGTVTRRVFVDVVSANYFETFGSPLALGRAFTPAEEEPDAKPAGRNCQSRLLGT